MMKKSLSPQYIALGIVLALIVVAILWIEKPFGEKQVAIENPKTQVKKGEYSKVATDEVVVGLHKGDIAPNFSGKTPEGKTVQLSDYLGKAVLVEFWATWCPICADEFPGLERVAKEYKDKFVVLAVNYREDPQVITQYFKETPYDFIPIVDQKGEIALAYGFVGTPHAYFLDKTGKIADVRLGAKDEAEIRQIVRQLVAK